MNRGNWLSDLDSNQDKSLQRALCYRYTIGQQAAELSFVPIFCKEICAFRYLLAVILLPGLRTLISTGREAWLPA